MGMLSLVTVSPVITAFHNCCQLHHVFDQVNLWPAWVGIGTAIFWQCSPGTVETQRLYPLRHGLSIPIRGRGKSPEGQRGNLAERKKQHKNYQDEDKKSAINKKLILRLRCLISKWFQFKRISRVQVLDETDCISHNTNTLGKGMNPIILPPAIGN